jgi:hypothetical protein
MGGGGRAASRFGVRAARVDRKGYHGFRARCRRRGRARLTTTSIIAPIAANHAARELSLRVARQLHPLLGALVTELASHAPLALHVNPIAQSLIDAHFSTHALASHTYGEHDVVTPLFAITEAPSAEHAAPTMHCFVVRSHVALLVSQSVSLAQLVLHSASPHANGVHGFVSSAPHPPCPSHTATNVCTPSEQLATRQPVFVGRTQV